MILSMTGYGKACVVFNGKKITAEIKSLNSKSLDLSTRVVAMYREKEMEIRNMISTALERGKVEFNLWTETEAATQAASINGAVAENYRKQIRHICGQYGMPEPENWWGLLMRLPDVVCREEAVAELTDEEWSVARGVIEQAIQQLVDFRKQEGLALQHKFEEKLDNIAQLMAAIEPFEKGRVEKIRQRLEENLEKIKTVEYDRNRLEQEMIYYIEKLDINEEKQRLANHLRYFRETMADGHGQGKKLGFIAQEMGREINTTGSKSNEAEMQNIVVRMKDELEQIKEQVLNVM
ncbi:MAG: YicC family protein [Bacteroidaceae bacterium]|nr:YicC family protein [Bacteroidaceae bacterium]